MEDWQDKTEDYYARSWIERQQSARWTESSIWLEWYELCSRINTSYWVQLFEDLAPGIKLLECGGATGQLTSEMAGRGWDCTQIDITKEGPVLARERFNLKGVKGYFVTGDVRRLPFQDATFDVVTSHGLLDLMPEIGEPIQEMMRVLKPGGLMAASFFPRRFSVQSLADSFIHCARILSSIVRTGNTTTRLDDLPSYANVFRNNYPLETYIKNYKEAGLTQVVGKGFWPVPMVNLPDSLMRKYLKLARALEPQWIAFNRSRSSWTAIWGVMLAVYGVKG